MQQNHAKALKGMSIAVVVLSGLGILGCLLSLLSVLGIGGAGLGALSSGAYSGYGSYSDAADIMMLGMAMGGVFFGWAMVCSIVTLVAGILALRNGDNPAKLGMVFGWSIAGAALSLLYGNIVNMVLFIIMAVFAHKDRQMAAAGYYPQAPYGDQAYYGAAPVAYGVPVAPAPGVPAQPMPMQPAQPMQPVQPAQPMQYPPMNPPMA